MACCAPLAQLVGSDLPVGYPKRMHSNQNFFQLKYWQLNAPLHRPKSGTGSPKCWQESGLKHACAAPNQSFCKGLQCRRPNRCSWRGARLNPCQMQETQRASCWVRKRRLHYFCCRAASNRSNSQPQGSRSLDDVCQDIERTFSEVSPSILCCLASVRGGMEEISDSEGNPESTFVLYRSTTSRKLEHRHSETSF